MLSKLEPEARTEKQLTDLLIEKERRFASYMANSREAVWRIDFEPPLSLQVPESQQVRNVFKTCVIREANDAMANMYGLSEGRELIGRPLREFMVQSRPENIQSVSRLVGAKFRLNAAVTYEKRSDASIGVFLNNTVPTISGDMILNMWGSSLDITDLYSTQERLKQSLEELALQRSVLKDKNIALKELVLQIAREKEDLKDQVMDNVEHVILPTLDRLRLDNTSHEYLEQHRKNLEDLTSSFGRSITNSGTKLTPREIEVCNLTRNGLSSKEISRLLSIALHTVEKHRRMSRKKLGLTNKGVNLQAYLSSL